LILARAPMRLPLGGGGTDLPAYYSEFGGSLLTAAIDKYVYVAVNRPPLDAKIRVKYSRSELVDRVEDVQHDLVRPALMHLGLTEQIEIASLADVSAGTGLGSSSSYLVALLLGLEGLLGRRPSKKELAELACHVEMNLAGHPVGKQDQYAAAFGGVLAMDIDRDGCVSAVPVDLDEVTIDALEERVLLFATGVERSANEMLTEQAGQLRRPDSGAVQAMHETREIGGRIKDALLAGDIDGFGALLHEHWEAKKRRSDMVTRPEIDAWYALARNAGAAGGKLVGAGGGGFLMLYATPDAACGVRDAMAVAGLTEMRFHFDLAGATVMTGLTAVPA